MTYKSKPALATIHLPAEESRSEPAREYRQTPKPLAVERLLTPREVAERLGVSERWVRDHATRRNPRITAVKLGSLLRFRWTDVEAFLSRQILQDSSNKRPRSCMKISVLRDQRWTIKENA
jgi:excisionase family DNA binding protein